MNNENNYQQEIIETPENVSDENVIEKKKLPLFSKILFIIAAFCALLYALFVFFPAFSDFFNKYISSVFRATLAFLTSWIPFSLAEYMLLLLPLAFIAASIFAIKRYADSWRNVGIFCLILLSIVSYIFSSFTIGFVPAYRGTPLDQKLGLDKKEVSAEELLDTSLILADKINADIDEILFTPEGFSAMPYGYEELNDKILDAYDKAVKKYDFIQDLHSKIKPIMLSEPMTYTHISGVYTFFTGEANFNTNYPDYVIPYTVAHEFAHQRGIASEDEANFVAFLVCSESDDAYIRYSAYVNLFEYVASALIAANKNYYAAVYNTLPTELIKEFSAYADFFEKYENSVVGEISGNLNETFIAINGARSYGMVVDLAVAYYKVSNA